MSDRNARARESKRLDFAGAAGWGIPVIDEIVTVAATHPII